MLFMQVFKSSFMYFKLKVLPETSPVSELVEPVKQCSYNLRVLNELIPISFRTNSLNKFFCIFVCFYIYIND